MNLVEVGIRIPLTNKSNHCILSVDDADAHILLTLTSEANESTISYIFTEIVKRIFISDFLQMDNDKKLFTSTWL